VIHGILTPTRAESGCELYELYESDSRRRFYLYETWERQAALDRHVTTPHFKRLEQTGAEPVKEPFEINIVQSIVAGAAARDIRGGPKAEFGLTSLLTISNHCDSISVAG
jgi:quinol monooxygenase YgiN